MNTAANPTLSQAATLPVLPDDLAPGIRQALISLHNSRMALREELVPPPQAPGKQRSASAFARLWWRRLRAWPVSQLAGEAVGQWWRMQPWQPLGNTLMGQLRGHVWPLVQRHPWKAVGGAAAVGAGLILARPWRWAWVDRRVRDMPRASSRWLLHQLTSAPVQATIASVLAMVAQKAGPAPAPVPSPTEADPSATAAEPVAVTDPQADPLSDVPVGPLAASVARQMDATEGMGHVQR